MTRRWEASRSTDWPAGPIRPDRRARTDLPDSRLLTSDFARRLDDSLLGSEPPNSPSTSRLHQRARAGRQLSWEGDSSRTLFGLDDQRDVLGEPPDSLGSSRLAAAGSNRSPAVAGGQFIFGVHLRSPSSESIFGVYLQSLSSESIFGVLLRRMAGTRRSSLVLGNQQLTAWKRAARQPRFEPPCSGGLEPIAYCRGVACLPPSSVRPSGGLAC